MRAPALCLCLAAGLSPAAAGAEARHALSLYGHSAGGLYLSRHQTAGGVGGGLGLRDTVDGRYLLQADVDYLAMLGNAVRLRVGAGVQRQGLWSPFALVTATTFVGDRLSFLTSQRPLPTSLPPFALGVSLAPARFRSGATTVSLLELGAGVGWDFPGAGFCVGVTLLEVSVDL